MRVAERVEQFTDQGIVHWFLVETDEGPVAVDAGFPTAWKQISERAGELRAIVLSHAHIDHLGFAPIVGRQEVERLPILLDHAAADLAHAGPHLVLRHQD